MAFGNYKIKADFGGERITDRNSATAFMHSEANLCLTLRCYVANRRGTVSRTATMVTYANYRNY